MRLHELVNPDRDVVVTNVLGHVLVLTPQGAVFDDLDTDDLLNMAPAFGMLFDDDWRLASNDERAELYKPKDKMFHSVWDDPPPRPPLTVVADPRN